TRTRRTLRHRNVWRPRAPDEQVAAVEPRTPLRHVGLHELGPPRPRARERLLRLFEKCSGRVHAHDDAGRAEPLHNALREAPGAVADFHDAVVRPNGERVEDRLGGRGAVNVLEFEPPRGAFALAEDVTRFAHNRRGLWGNPRG